jgi:outer membrane receptor protein involved in Fe transport
VNAVGRSCASAGCLLCLLGLGGHAEGQTVLPRIDVVRPAPVQRPARVARKPAVRPVAVVQHAMARSTRPQVVRAAPHPAPVAGPAPQAGGPIEAQPGAAAVIAQATRMDAGRANILPRAGANAYDLGHEAIDSLPQGTHAPLDKVLLQMPGVTQDSAASGSFHVRNEHANVQYRINGVFLPEGVSGFGQIIETGFVGNLALLDGALPAQYGLRTAGIIDITSRAGAFDNGGRVGVYGGSQTTLTPTFEYGGTSGPWQYFITGRYFSSKEGIENTTPAYYPIHDFTKQGKYFGYASANIDETTRLSFISGSYTGRFQIPNTPGQMPSFTAFGFSDFPSTQVNENQIERTYYNVAAIQKSVGDIDAQLSYFSRLSSVRFTPDRLGDLLFNGVASDIYRASLLNGVQGEMAYRVHPAHTLRLGFIGSAEKTHVVNSSTLLPLDADGNPIDAPFGVLDQNSKIGWLFGAYAQDEWRLTDKITLNAGARFDQMVQFVTANQLSPRASVTYKPVDGTTFHAAYARYFTPPNQALAAPTNLPLFNNTTQQPEVNLNDPVRPERSLYVDIGVTQRLAAGLDVGIDAYYKRARNLLDDGQFGAAYVLTAFNYDRAYNAGIEFKANYQMHGFRLYGNLAIARQRATQVTSNQFLFGMDEYSYIASHYIYTDHAQTITASAGASYKWNGTRLSVDMIYGSGLRSGFANTEHVPAYTQVNAGIAQEVPVPGMKPLTLRFDVTNVFDHVYELRDGSGIGVFAPQFGPRRGFFGGLSQRF